MIPRKRFDIGWTDLGYGLARCIVPPARNAIRERLEFEWSANGNALACLSVRSGFDLLLQHLAFPRGSEIVVSAITIRDMVAILEHHGLRAIPVDIDPQTCAPRLDLLERAITPRSKAVLVAHLFGSRMDMTGLLALASRHKLFVFEDCAQAYAADGYRGHPASDVAMFSFGPIKTATALGGALLTFRERVLRATVQRMQLEYPTQSKIAYAQRLCKYAILKGLSYRAPYTLFTGLCRWLGHGHDRIISGAARSFAGGNLIQKLRHQPSAPLHALLARRLRDTKPAHLAARITGASYATARLPATTRIGEHAQHHSHWVLPVRSSQPDVLVRHLWRHGIDATRGASSMYAVRGTGDHSAPPAACELMEHVVYLPLDGVTAAEIDHIIDSMNSVETNDTLHNSAPQMALVQSTRPAPEPER
jgi:dTDP-4-amino-4,6-dideoxygalactose transaminase